jgi:hypothetical protein
MISHILLMSQCLIHIFGILRMENILLLVLTGNKQLHFVTGVDTFP